MPNDCECDVGDMWRSKMEKYKDLEDASSFVHQTERVRSWATKIRRCINPDYVE